MKLIDLSQMVRKNLSVCHYRIKCTTDQAFLKARAQQQRGRSLPRPQSTTGSSRLGRELPLAPSSRSEERAPPASDDRRRGSTVTSR